MTEETFFEKSTPEAQGIPSRAIEAFLDGARGVRDLHSFLLLRRGQVVAEGYWEPYGPEHRHMFFSLSKSFTSTAIGLLVAEGKLSVDDPVLKFFADEAPASPSANLRAMRVRHLLTMTTGHHEDPTRLVRELGASWTRGFLALPVEHEPGTYFVYNSLATYMLSAIAQKLSGERVLEYLGPRLYEPLGIEGPTWEQSPEGIDAGGWGMSARTRDIARFGQLYLQKGVWRGKRLLPESWVEEATSRQVPNGPSENVDWVQGYGYQFWRCRHGAYRGDGAFGQFCVVMPAQEAVLAITAGVQNMQAVLDLVWTHLLPALGAGSLKEDPGAARALEDRLGSLRLAPTEGKATSPAAGGTFELAANDEGFARVGFEFGTDGATISLDGARVACGYGRWVRGELAMPGGLGALGRVSPKIAASGAWADDRTYVADLVWYETPFRRTLTCRFDGEGVTIEQRQNVSFGPTERPTLEGRALARNAAP